MKQHPKFFTAMRNEVGLVLKRLRYGGDRRECPVCGEWSRAFAPAGAERRLDAQCLFCGAMERHRLVWVFLSWKRLLDGRGKRMLHVAPEPCLSRHFAVALGNGYITADLQRDAVTVRIDVERIPFLDERFDFVYCSHVLEHVPNDRRAMREFRRVLKKSGWAILLVPITATNTFEDPTIVSPEQRRDVFGQEDHLRRYGSDYVHRLEEAGFVVERYAPSDVVADSNDRARMGLTPASGEIYFCRKP